MCFSEIIILDPIKLSQFEFFSYITYMKVYDLSQFLT